MQLKPIVHEGMVLHSSFQPIYSLSHRRLVGHEALLRAVDANGHPLSPLEAFERCDGAAARRALDANSLRQHARTFVQRAEMPQWLFLNLDASWLSTSGHAASTALWNEISENAGLHPWQTVLEVLEAALPQGRDAEDWAAAMRELGYLVALDDFGAGHSNFDRVFRLHPDVVKLDRSLTFQAANDRRVRRVMAQMISLLHECGALVLLEGVETASEAAVALDADVDLVQGFHFGRPHPEPRLQSEANDSLAAVWALNDEQAQADLMSYREIVGPYVEALLEMKRRLQVGVDVTTAFEPFLALEHADLCFLLGADGSQLGPNAFQKRVSAQSAVANQYLPLADVRQARWSRRPYFRRAMANPGQVQITRPYPTMYTRRLSVTLSVSFETADGVRVVCGDMHWQADEASPTFGSTTFDIDAVSHSSLHAA